MFSGELVIKRPTGSKDRYELVMPITWQDEKYVIMVPAGFVYDGASVPKALRSVIPSFGGRYDRASALHDYLYSHGSISRRECDKIFYHALRDDKVRWVQAKIMYFAVRLFGKKHYKEGYKDEMCL